MNAKTLAVIVVGIVIAGGLWYLLVNGSKTSLPFSPSSVASETSPSGQAASVQPAGGTTAAGGASRSAPARETIGIGSINDLLALRKDLICSVALSTSKLKRSGTVYVANGEMRGDFIASAGGTVTVVSMVDDGTNLYAWSDKNPDGLKLSASSSVSGSAISAWGALDPATSLDYSCLPWQADPGFFVPLPSVMFSATAGK